jgi:sugar phosphate isomerase/epimerase
MIMAGEDLSKLCIHTITTKNWTLETAVEKYLERGIGGISVWRNYLEGRSLGKVRSLFEANNVTVVSLVRGGFFTGMTRKERVNAINENKKAMEEAAAIGAVMVVLVCGSTPGQLLNESRIQIRDGIEKILPMAEELKVKLAIEPLHPMYADTRSAINTMDQANTLAEYFNSKYVGVAVDVYHVWWDGNLKEEIMRCGENNNLFAFHLCDWRNPTRDMLNDRTIMGEGVIPVQEIINMVNEAGFKGFYEVEIFSNQHWSEDQDEFLNKIVKAYLKYES